MQYLHQAVPGDGNFIRPVEATLTEDFLLDFLAEAEVSRNLVGFLDLSAKCTGIYIPNPTTNIDECHKVLLGIRKNLVGLLLTW